MSRWRSALSAVLAGGALWCAGPAGAAEIPKDACGSACQREEVFEFAKPPVFRRLGQDQYEITFASKGNCDVSVGITDREGTVVRHLACGVLGDNAPAPLKAHELEQTLLWDGKNDLGRFVDAPETCKVKVGLGLKPQFEKVLMHHPKRLGQWTFGVAADQDGVYVFNYHNAGFFLYGEGPICPDTTQILVYDHKGDYARTIFPFPHDKIRPDAYARSPLEGQPPASGASPVMKKGPPFSFVLPSGRAVISPDPTSPWGQGSYFPHILEDNAFVVEKGVLTLVYKDNANQEGLRFLRLGTDGSMPEGGYCNGESVFDGVSGPCWLGVSPEGQWMYVSGLGKRKLDFIHQVWEWRVMGQKEQAEHAVYRMRYDKPAPATGSESFLGVKGEPGNDNRHFRFPEGVACDKEGRVYVADSGNNRVQVFDASGQYVKTLAVPEPYAVAVHRGTGAIYVGSFEWALGQLIVTRFKSLTDTEKPIQWIFNAGAATNRKYNLLQKINHKAAWPGVWQSMGTWFPVLCIDEWAAEPTIWTMTLDCELVMLVDKGDRLDLKRNLHQEWRSEWKAKGWDPINPTPTLGNIAAEPNGPYIYVGDCSGNGTFDYNVWGERLGWTPRVNVETGEVHYVPAVSAVGYDGLAYSYDKQSIWRFDAASINPAKFPANISYDTGPFGGVRRYPALVTPVAFDYGSGALGDISYPYCSGSSGGLGISPQGGVILHDYFPPLPGFEEKQSAGTAGWANSSGRMPEKLERPLPVYLLPDSAGFTEAQRSLQGYTRRAMFPGGLYKGSSALVQFNEKGQVENNNLIAGLPRDVSGVQVDFQGNVYVGLYFAKAGPDGKPLTGRSVAKFQPKGGRIMVNGTAVPVPLAEEPKRPPDFLTMGYTGGRPSDTGPDGKPGRVGDKAWAEGMLWSVGGYSWEERMPARFALDYYGRLFMPEIHRNSVAIVDGGGNFIMRLGDYGNADDCGPEIRMADTRFVAVSDRRLFIHDTVNRRILSVRLDYQKEAEVGCSR